METLANISVALRREIRKLLFLFLVLFMVSWALSGYAILEMKSSLLPQGYELIITEPGEYVMARFQVALAMMLLFSIPILGSFALKVKIIKLNAIKN